MSTLFDGPNAGETKRIDGSAFGASTVGVGVGVGVAVAVAVGVGVAIGAGAFASVTKGISKMSTS